jgi:amyloid beta A4 protein
LHAEFQEAQQRLEESHREKVTRVMKDWSDLEEKYQVGCPKYIVKYI